VAIPRLNSSLVVRAVVGFVLDRKAAVIGSGVMGGGIAALLASAGVKTLLLDIVPFDLKEEKRAIRSPETGSPRRV
jgi:phosphoglycerate dehydrogenase-like enzyme